MNQTVYILARNLRHQVISAVKAEWFGGLAPEDKFTITGQYDRYYQVTDEKNYNKEKSILEQAHKGK